MTREEYIKEITSLLDPLVQIDFPYPFSPDGAGDQEEVVGLFKDEENNVQVLVWNWDEGGDRGEDVYNQEYALNSELFSEDDLEEIYSQLLIEIEKKNK